MHEVTDLLAAMNTGHEGGCGTVHANSAADVPARIEALAMAAGMPQAAAHSQLASAVDAVVHLGRGPDGARRVAEVAVLRRGPDGRVVAVPAVTFPLDGSTVEHPEARPARASGWADESRSPRWLPRWPWPCCCHGRCPARPRVHPGACCGAGPDRSPSSWSPESRPAWSCCSTGPG